MAVILLFYVIPFLLMITGLLTWTLRPGKNTTESRRTASWVTAISVGITAVVSIAAQLFHYASGEWLVSTISGIFIDIGLGFIGLAILVLIGFAIARRGEIAKGIGFGISVGIIAIIVESVLVVWIGRAWG
jgi:uncharacterized membrane protein required for colicin V production